MTVLTQNNCSIDKKSGAVIFHKSPELIEILKLKKELKNINDKIDLILDSLKKEV